MARVRQRQKNIPPKKRNKIQKVINFEMRGNSDTIKRVAPDARIRGLK